MDKDSTVLFNLKRENEKLKEQLKTLQFENLQRQDIIDKMTDRLLERAQQLVQVTSALLKVTVPRLKEEPPVPVPSEPYGCLPPDDKE